MATVRSIATGLSADVFEKEHEDEMEQKYDAKEQFDRQKFRALSDALKEAVSQCSYPHFTDAYISNIEFICADATEFLQACAANRLEGPAFDVLCMDPPRTGSTPEFIRAASALAIPKIVYVSCGPESLARDLKEFCRCGYRIMRVVPVDMFPFTKDVETVCLLENQS